MNSQRSGTVLTFYMKSLVIQEAIYMPVYLKARVRILETLWLVPDHISASILFLTSNDVIKKFKLTNLSTKFSHNVNSLVLKGPCKFQVDIPINARVVAVQSLENCREYRL